MSTNGSGFFDEGVDYSTDTEEETLDFRSEISGGDDDDDDGDGGFSFQEEGGAAPEPDDPGAPSPEPSEPIDTGPSFQEEGGAAPEPDDPGAPGGDGGGGVAGGPSFQEEGGAAPAPGDETRAGTGAPAQQGLETQTGEQETVAVGDPRAVFGQQTDPVGTIGTVARNVEQRFLEQNPQFSAEDIAIQRTDTGLATVFTQQGLIRQRQLARGEFEGRFEEQVGVDVEPGDIDVEREGGAFTGALSSGFFGGLTAEERRTVAVETAADPFRQAELEQEAGRAEAGRQSLFTPFGNIDTFRQADIEGELGRAEAGMSSLFTGGFQPSARRRAGAPGGVARAEGQIESALESQTGVGLGRGDIEFQREDGQLVGSLSPTGERRVRAAQRPFTQLFQGTPFEQPIQAGAEIGVGIEMAAEERRGNLLLDDPFEGGLAPNVFQNVAPDVDTGAFEAAAAVTGLAPAAAAVEGVDTAGIPSDPFGIRGALGDVREETTGDISLERRAREDIAFAERALGGGLGAAEDVGLFGELREVREDTTGDIDLGERLREDVAVAERAFGGVAEAVPDVGLFGRLEGVREETTGDIDLRQRARDDIALAERAFGGAADIAAGAGIGAGLRGVREETTGDINVEDRIQQDIALAERAFGGGVTAAEGAGIPGALGQVREETTGDIDLEERAREDVEFAGAAFEALRESQVPTNIREGRPIFEGVDVSNPFGSPEALAAAAPFAVAEPTPFGEVALGVAAGAAGAAALAERVDDDGLPAAQARATAELPGLFPPEQPQPTEPVGRGFFPPEQEVGPSSLELPELLAPTDASTGEGPPLLTPPEIEQPTEAIGRGFFPPEQAQPTEPIGRGFFPTEIDVPLQTGGLLQQRGRPAPPEERTTDRRRRRRVPDELIPGESVVIGGGGGRQEEATEPSVGQGFGPRFEFLPGPRSMELRRADTPEGGFVFGPVFTRFLGAQQLDADLGPEIEPFQATGTLPPAEAAGGEFAAANTFGLAARRADTGVDALARQTFGLDIFTDTRPGVATRPGLAVSPLTDTQLDQRQRTEQTLSTFQFGQVTTNPFTTDNPFMNEELFEEFRFGTPTVTPPGAPRSFEFGFEIPEGDGGDDERRRIFPTGEEFENPVATGFEFLFGRQAGGFGTAGPFDDIGGDADIMDLFGGDR